MHLITMKVVKPIAPNTDSTARVDVKIVAESRIFIIWYFKPKKV